MGNLYRILKGKVEGSSLNGKHCHGKKSHIGGCAAGGKQGMADALAEITKRFAIVTSIILLLIAIQSCLCYKCVRMCVYIFTFWLNTGLFLCVIDLHISNR